MNKSIDVIMFSNDKGRIVSTQSNVYIDRGKYTLIHVYLLKS